MALARIRRRVYVIVATKTLGFLAGALGGGPLVSTRLVGTDEVVPALRADPLASNGITFKAFKFCLCRLCRL